MLSRALQRMWQDVLFAFRALRQHPVFGSLVYSHCRGRRHSWIALIAMKE